MLRLFKDSILFPSEIISAFRLKFGGYIKKTYKDKTLEQCSKDLNDIDFCYEVLNRVSRSFAVVIQQLPPGLKDAVCIFYLVLRGLDSVEDDMTYPNDLKIPLLKTFYTKLNQDGWTIENVGDSSDYRILLAHFDKVIKVFKTLDKGYRNAIINITKEMGYGMAKYADKDGSIPTIKQYNEYCHYVAGLVGWGLSDLFVAGGYEDDIVKNDKTISNNMGLFLQKTNIIRDYLEDLEDGRTWWPTEIWSKYANNLADFKNNPNDIKSLNCLNHLVQDALSLVPDCITYMSRLKTKEVFAFCAIPQIMAMATLEKVYNNLNVFKQNVKIRKGLSCKIMLNCYDMNDLNNWFYAFSCKFLNKAKKINDMKSISLLNDIQKRTKLNIYIDYNQRKILYFTSLLAIIMSLYEIFVKCSCCNTNQYITLFIASIFVLGIYNNYL